MNNGNYRPISCIHPVANIMERNFKSIWLKIDLLQETNRLIVLCHSKETGLNRLDILDGASDGLYSGVYFIVQAIHAIVRIFNMDPKILLMK